MFFIETYKKRFDANKVKIAEKGGHPYIVRQSSNNGQKGFIEEDEKYLNEGNTLSFGQDTATIFYQGQPYFTGDKIKILKCKHKRFSRKNSQFFVAAVTKAFSSFSWGTSSYSIDVIENQIIKLPVRDHEIDFDFMESFIAALEAERLAELSAYLKISGFDNYELSPEELNALDNLKNIEWGEYRMGALFEKIQTNKLPYKAKDLPNEAIDHYVLPCLTSSFKNQGLNYFAPIDGATVLKDVITIPQNSDVYRAYYQSADFTVLSDAYAIEWKYDERKISRNQQLFMVMCINKVTDLPIYSYKNKLGGWNVVKNKYILLPQSNGKIDLDFMEIFIAAIQKLVIKDVVLYADNKIHATKRVVEK